ncbi:HAD family phosphatase [Streptomyces sp. NPDC026673]|uniref:HAD family hydrolase n=1 Tax=Streptomyces sp. NPDC026673 TaxID=3155724 RepID=UPI0033FEEF15
MTGIWRPRAVLFDCDGTLMDTEPGLRRAKADTLARHGLVATEALHLRMTGRSLADIAAVMAEALGRRHLAPRLSAELLTACVARAHDALPLPGALHLLKIVGDRVPTAVVSNAPRVLLHATLAAGGLSSAFGAVVSEDDVAAPKPAPDPYLRACALLRVRPDQAVAFEDSPVGLAAAAAAGVTAVHVTPDNPLDAPALLAWTRSWAA